MRQDSVSNGDEPCTIFNKSLLPLLNTDKRDRIDENFKEEWLTKKSQEENNTPKKSNQLS